MKQEKIHRFGEFKAMWVENGTFKHDLENICKSGFIPWEQLRGKRILITGATGLIGYTITSALLYYNLINAGGVKVTAIVRDLKKAEQKFSGQLLDGCELDFIQGTVEKFPKIDGPINYIIHCACPTASKFFVENPVETMQTIMAGTENVLKIARDKQVSGIVYLSSMEVFGAVRSREKLREQDLGYIDILSPRSSYSEGKRFTESLCCAYAVQYQVPVTIARLAQTFGPGVDQTDGRVFAYMARCALKGETIRLNTSGSKENMYLYTMDAASAILLLLLKGERGTAYNIGNPRTYCSVKEMGELVATELCGGHISVITNVGQGENKIYRPESYLNMDTSKLEALGWSACVTLLQMFKNMIASF